MFKIQYNIKTLIRFIPLRINFLNITHSTDLILIPSCTSHTNIFTCYPKMFQSRTLYAPSLQQLVILPKFRPSVSFVFMIIFESVDRLTLNLACCKIWSYFRLAFVFQKRTSFYYSSTMGTFNKVLRISEIDTRRGSRT